MGLGVEGTLVVEGEVHVLVGRTVSRVDGDAVEVFSRREDVCRGLWLGHVDLAVFDGLDHGHRIAVVANRDGVDLRLDRTCVLVVEFESDVLALFELGHLVRTVVDEEVLVLGHRGEVEARVPHV